VPRSLPLWTLRSWRRKASHVGVAGLVANGEPNLAGGLGIPSDRCVEWPYRESHLRRKSEAPRELAPRGHVELKGVSADAASDLDVRLPRRPGCVSMASALSKSGPAPPQRPGGCRQRDRAQDRALGMPLSGPPRRVRAPEQALVGPVRLRRDAPPVPIVTRIAGHSPCASSWIIGPALRERGVSASRSRVGCSA